MFLEKKNKVTFITTDGEKFDMVTTTKKVIDTNVTTKRPDHLICKYQVNFPWYYNSMHYIAGYQGNMCDVTWKLFSIF